MKFSVRTSPIEEQLLTNTLLYDLFISYLLLVEYNFATVKLPCPIISEYFVEVKLFFLPVDLPKCLPEIGIWNLEYEIGICTLADGKQTGFVTYKTGKKAVNWLYMI
jgi:hypothetical protein